VVAATRGLDRGRVDRKAVDAAFDADLARWIQVQKDAQLDFCSDGLLRWQDIFRPMVEALKMKPHTLVRWFDTNTFYREPEFSGAPGRLTSPNGALPQPSLPSPRVLTLPSPFLFSRAAQTAGDRNRLMIELAGQVLRPVIDAAVKTGATIVHLEEPWLPYRGIEAADWAPLKEALEFLHRDLGATLVFHCYFGDAGPYIEQLRTLPVDAIGVDVIETDVSELGRGWGELGLLAGIMNGRNAIVESTETLVDVATHLADVVRPRNLYLSSNCELAFLPTTVAERKVQRLGEAARKLRQLVSV
jgi:5-methyltetrahydropteroyltriglutamate--homocysteine methyltransferase